VDAMIFDFDGVVVDSEPVHFAGFRRVLADVGVTMTEDAYYRLYLGYDDHDCLQVAARDHGVTLDEDRIAALTATKTQFVQQAFAESITALPGAVELVAAAAGDGVAVGVCSGALRPEIELAARTVGALPHFQWIVAAEDVEHGKPDPEGYVMALEHARRVTGSEIRAERSLVVEDSPAGIQAGKDAGCRVLAVTTSYPADQLTAADRIVGRLNEVTLEELKDLTDA